jgi:hypothetical protein
LLKQKSKTFRTRFTLRYRPEGWTITQVVHHCADSHINSYMRFKLALTENVPTIKPYEESLWAELPDNQFSPLVSLQFWKLCTQDGFIF